MRSQYLGDLARVCNCPPPMVDALRFVDFISLVLYIDAYYEARKKNATPEMEI